MEEGKAWEMEKEIEPSGESQKALNAVPARVVELETEVRERKCVRNHQTREGGEKTRE
jgi:hypothetical protein